MEVLLIIIIILLIAVLASTLIIHNRQRRDIKKLIKAINDFSRDGINIQFSLNDNLFAELQNAINDLAHLIKLEKHNTEKQSKKNIEFVSDISHQLKTPLSALRLYCEMDNEENRNTHSDKQLQLIDKMESLVQNLLKLQKLQSDTYVMNFEKSEICLLVKDITDEFSVIYKPKKYIIIGNGGFRFDKVWMTEAISNILKNASEHTDENGIIEIKISDTSESTIIEIQDNGNGIPENELADLFTRFVKTKNSLPTSTGIGLAISKAIVEKHHGIINAENKSYGLCVTMCFPHIDGYETIN